MAKKPVETDWMSVIGKCLAYLCLENAKKLDADKFNTVPKRVEFLKGVGLPQADAAYVAGSTPDSVAALERRANKSGKKRGGKKAKKRN